MTLVFQNNIINSSPKSFFDNFQIDSEALVFQSILTNTSNSNFGLTARTVSIEDLTNLINKNESLELDDKVYYKAQLGLLGKFWSVIYNNLFDKNIDIFNLHLINSILTSITLLAVISFIYRYFSKSFAFIIFISLIGSPWFVASARNLYMGMWLWLLPLIFVALYSKRKSSKGLYLSFFYLAMFFKFGSGLEQSTVYFLLPIFFYYVINMRTIRITDIRTIIYLVIVELLAFSTSLILLAMRRGEGSIVVGLKSILETDVKRRTYGDPKLFDTAYSDSLNSNPISVIKTYIFNWDTEVLQFQLPGLPLVSLGQTIFVIFTALSIYSLIILFHYNKVVGIKYIIFYFGALAVPISWFVLGKSHSYMHTHILFLLWYLFYIPTIIFIPSRTIQLISGKKSLYWISIKKFVNRLP